MTLLVGVMLGGVGAVYLVAAGGYSPLWVSLGYCAVTGGLVGWYWYTGLPDLPPETAA
jgi:hypothetical protein